MQVKCSKCSQPIALTDIIESSDGRVSHVDCNTSCRAGGSRNGAASTEAESPSGGQIGRPDSRG